MPWRLRTKLVRAILYAFAQHLEDKAPDMTTTGDKLKAVEKFVHFEKWNTKEIRRAMRNFKRGDDSE